MVYIYIYVRLINGQLAGSYPVFYWFESNPYDKTEKACNSVVVVLHW